MPMQSCHRDVNGARLYCEIAGAGEPLVLIHGFSLDHRMWDDQFEAFAQAYRVVRYDLRGFGQSALPAGPTLRARV
jgi:pimeloyl-ACP methyl ester carboxylesterase